MKIVIHKNTHYPYLIPLALPIWVSKKYDTEQEFQFMFTDSCMFDLHDEDQWDVNKLFGFSIGHHHNRNSFRFGWRPILKNNTIEIVGYEYHEGWRVSTIRICEIELNRWYNFKLTYSPSFKYTQYQVNNILYTNSVDLIHTGGLGYTLGVYFGGNEKALQKIVIYRRNEKTKINNKKR